MTVYLLELNIPYEGSIVQGVYSSMGSALSKGLRLTMERDDLESPPEYMIDDEVIIIEGSYDYYTITPKEIRD